MFNFPNRADTRPDPLMPSRSYKTFQVVRPLMTHFRKVSCVDFDCPNYAAGWATTVMPGGADEAAVRQALAAGWRATETRAEGGFLRFTFPAGQRCFASLGTGHQVPLDRDPLFLVRRGDHRHLDAPDRVHRDAVDWRDDFAEHQDKLATAINEG